MRKLEQEAEALVGRVEHEDNPERPGGAIRVVECAIGQSRGFGHNYIGTEHLLLGILDEAKGLGSQLLRELGTTLVATNEEVKRLLS
jgi:ATP-dependent Clp protease ATP-binding subunit ClpA